MKKKQRGQKRKLKKLVWYLTEQTSSFPEEHSSPMDHWHMPCAERFLNSPKTSGKIKTKAMQCMMDRCVFLEQERVRLNIDAKLFVMISVPDVWNAEILLFYHPKTNPYYQDFFKRNAEGQVFLPYNGRSLQEERRLNLPAEFSEKAYTWQVTNEDNHTLDYQTTLWFYGKFDEVQS